MKLSSTVVYTSEIDPDVKFTVRVLNHIQRASRDLGISAHLAAYADNERKRLSLLREIVGTETDPKKQTELIRASDKGAELGRAVVDSDLIYEAHIQPAEIRAGLVKVEGLEIDGCATPTVDQVIAWAPDNLLREIARRCNENAGLGAEQQKNLESPGTSVRQES